MRQPEPIALGACSGPQACRARVPRSGWQGASDEHGPLAPCSEDDAATTRLLPCGLSPFSRLSGVVRRLRNTGGMRPPHAFRETKNRQQRDTSVYLSRLLGINAVVDSPGQQTVHFPRANFGLCIIQRHYAAETVLRKFKPGSSSFEVAKNAGSVLGAAAKNG